MMMLNKNGAMGITFLAACLITNFTVSAGENNAPGSGPNPFVDCGIGAALFPETPWAAVSSNVIWDVGTTAVISATASPQTCSGKEMEVAMFIGNTYEKLAEETAAGQGEHLTTVLNLFDCGPAQHAGAMQELRSAMGREVSAKNYMGQSKLEKASNYYFIAEDVTGRNCSS
jgi:hypothetical protein